MLVEREPSRRRLEERKSDPDELDSNGAEGEAARGDPACMRSWLSCLALDGSLCSFIFFHGLDNKSLFGNMWQSRTQS
jgi:hypothetical protein